MAKKGKGVEGQRERENDTTAFVLYASVPLPLCFYYWHNRSTWWVKPSVFNDERISFKIEGP